MNTADNLKELFKKRGTQARCSEATGIPESLLSNYKNGLVDPSLPNAVLIAQYFDVSLDWLGGREGYTRDSHKHRTHSPSPSITAEERSIVEDYRRMDDGDKPGFISTAHALAYAGDAKKEGAGRPEEDASELVTQRDHQNGETLSSR